MKRTEVKEPDLLIHEQVIAQLKHHDPSDQSGIFSKHDEATPDDIKYTITNILTEYHQEFNEAVEKILQIPKHNVDSTFVAHDEYGIHPEAILNDNDLDSHDFCNLALKDVADIRRQWRHFNEKLNDDLCGICQVGMQFAQNLLCMSDNYPLMREILKVLCRIVTELLDSHPDMCEGLVTLQGPFVFVMVRNTIPTEICEMLNYCFPPPVPNKPTVSDRMAQLLSPKRSPEIKPLKVKTSAKTNGELRVAQLTDIHVQPIYAIGSGTTNCGMYICCLDEYPGEGSAAKYGEYRCNLPEITMHIMLDKLAELDPDVIIYSGDSAPHTIWVETLLSQLNCSDIVVKALKSKLPGKIIYPNIGNHETYPTNIYSGKLNVTRVLNEALISMWGTLAGFETEQEETMRKLGYYTTLVPGHPNLRVLSINTNHYWYTLNFMAPLNRHSEEEVEHRAFINDTLTQARTAGEKVIVIGHHPVGGSSATVLATRWWEEVALEFSDVILLHVSGHTHSDEFHLFMDPVTLEPKSINIVAPSVTSNTNVNPSLRIYHIDNTTYEILNIENYHMELDTQKPDSPPPVAMSYDAKGLYDMPDFSPQSWKSLTLRFLEDDALFRTWHSNRNSHGPNGGCDAYCKAGFICRMWFPNYDESSECYDLWSEVITTQAPKVTTQGPEIDSALAHDQTVAFVALVLFLQHVMQLMFV